MTRAEVEEYRALRRSEGRAGAGQFLLEGWRALVAAIAANAPIVDVAARAEALYRPELSALRQRGVPIRAIGERDLERLSATEHSQGVIARVRIVRHEVAGLLSAGERVLVALDAVADPGNVGTIIRTLDWFGAGGMLLGKGCVDPFNDKVVRATAGSLFHLPIVSDLDLPSALREAQSAGFAVTLAAADGSIPVGKWRPGSRNLIVLGSEAFGASEAIRPLADEIVAIPRFGRAESLNVAIAAGIFLAQARMPR
jgi:TrmH family RNA methyltransferase